MKRSILVIALLCFAINVHSQTKLKHIVSKPKQELKGSIVPSNEADSLLQKEIDSLKQIIDDFSVIRNVMEKQLLNEHKDFHSQSFHSIDTLKLDSLIMIGKCVNSENLTKWINNLTNVKKLLGQYNTYNPLIQQEYDKSAIDSATVHIKEIIGQCSEIQKNEFDILLNKLNLYPEAINKSYEIVYNISDKISRYRDDNNVYFALGISEEILEGQDFLYQDYISKIPYTDSLYSNFKKAILEKPLEVSEYEKKILSFESLITND